VDPVVVGKPHTPLYELSVSVLGTSVDRTLAIGDRLDTDIMGATAAGMKSLFVFGGVHGWADLVGAQPLSRPRYIATDLRSLHMEYGEPTQDAGDSSRWVCGDAASQVTTAGHLEVSDTGELNERARAALAALWQASDQRGRSVDPFGGDGAGLALHVEKATANPR
jgi:glycerol 3-phosphatase-2